MPTRIGALPSDARVCEELFAVVNANNAMVWVARASLPQRTTSIGDVDTERGGSMFRTDHAAQDPAQTVVHASRALVLQADRHVCVCHDVQDKWQFDYTIHMY